MFMFPLKKLARKGLIHPNHHIILLISPSPITVTLFITTCPCVLQEKSSSEPSSPLPASMSSERPLDIPKEVWRLVNHLYLYGMDQVSGQCLKLSQISCWSSCLESQIINMKLKKNPLKLSSPPPKLSVSDRRTCGNFQHC